MANSKLERDLPFIEENWKRFMSLVKDEISNEYTSLRELELEIKKFSRIEKIVRYSENNINFLIDQKEFFIEIDKSLESKFNILEAFKKRNNLDNDIALRTYKSIIENGSIQKVLQDLPEEKGNADLTRDYINRLKDLVNGEVYSFDLITELTSKYDLDSQARNAILIYPIIKSARIKPKTKEKTNELDNTVEEKPNYRYLYDIQRERYKKICEANKDLLDKYYNKISSMSPIVNTTFAGYIKLTEIEADELSSETFGKDYPDCKSIITAMKLFDTKSDIDTLMENIVSSEYSSSEDVEFLNAYIDQFDSLVKKLELLNDKLELTEATNDVKLDESRVFFLTDEDGKPFITEQATNEYNKSLVNLINKGDQGLTARRKGSNIKHMLGKKTEELEGKLDKTIFMLINGKLVVSYFKVNLEGKEENNEGIVIITSSGLHPNNIVENTHKVIKGNLDQVLTQIASIEGCDKKQVKLQESIRKKIMDSVIEEVDLHGTKAK